MTKRFDIHKVPSDLLAYKKTFCIDVARWLFEFSALSYHDDINIIEPQVESVGFKLKTYIDVDKTECMIVHNDDLIIVSFTGTELQEWQDIFTDIQFWHSKAEVGKVHTGFYKAYHKIKFPVYRAVLELMKEKPRKIYWAGHSLGGALAVIFATYYKSGIVYTYGQPKVGNHEFASHAEKTITLFRVTNTVDIVVPLPPKILGYEHFGTEIQYMPGPKQWSLHSIGREMFFFFARMVIQLFFKYGWLVSKLGYYIVKGVLYHTLNAYRRLLWTNSYLIIRKPTPEEIVLMMHAKPY